MANKIQFRRGTDAQRQAVTFDSGEPVLTTDTKKLWMGDGSTIGGIYVGGVGFTVVSKTTHYTAADSEIVLADATSGNLDISLPTALSNAQVIVKKTDSSTHTVTIVTPGAETIEGAAELVISAQGTSYTVICDGTNWFII